MNSLITKIVAVVVFATILLSSSAFGAEPKLDDLMQAKQKEWSAKRIWQPELPEATGETRPVTCRVVSYGGKWSRHGFGGHAGGPCMFRYSRTEAYEPFPGASRDALKMKQYSPVAYDVDGDGDKNDDFIAALTFSLSEQLGILDWPRSATFPGRYSAKFYGGNGWYVSDAKAAETHFIQEIGINCDHSGAWYDTRAEDHPLNGAANEKIASSGLRYYFVPVWIKNDFLNGGDRYKVTFDDSSFFGSLCMRGYWAGFDDVRYIVADGKQLYISDTKQYNVRRSMWSGEEPGSIFAFYPTKATWAKYNPKGHVMHFDPKGVKFAKHDFKDIQAVGWYLAKNDLNGKLAHAKWYGAEFKATVNMPKSLKSVNIDMKKIPKQKGVHEFSMSTCEVPYMLWKRIWEWGDASHYTLDQRYLYRKTGDMGSMRLGNKSHSQDEPVTNLNFYDTLAWCNTLSELEGKSPCYYTDPEFKNVFRNMHQATWYQGRINPKETKKPEPVIYIKWAADGHRLPTPAEWKSARGKVITGKKGESTSPVGSGKSNALGMYDMDTNVWELTWTYGNSYDPQKDLDIVAVGGSFHGRDNPEDFSASPYGDVPFDGQHAIGFRLVSREPGLDQPEQGVLAGLASWTIRKDARLAGTKKAEPAGPGQIETVAIAAGTFRKKKNTIKISAMHMGKTEVTFAQWEKVKQWAQARGYEFDTFGDMGSMFFHGYDHSPQEPVVRIRWNDMLIWCNALSEMEGRTPVYYTDEKQTQVYRQAFATRPPKTDGWDMIRPGGPVKTKGASVLAYAQQIIYTRWDTDGYRLPTCAEWTYARGKSRNDDEGWTMLNSAGKTHPVAAKKPNALGLYDLKGNVYEWLWDHHEFKGDTMRAKLDNNNPKNGMFWVWEEDDSENYQDVSSKSKIKHAKLYAGTGWCSAQAVGGSWLWSNPAGYPWRTQMHYADLGFRVVRCDAKIHPRDGLYAWDKLPVMLDTAGKKFEMNSGNVWRGDNGRSGVYSSNGVRKLKGVKWTYETGGKVTSSPLVVDGRMYIGTAKGVLCLDATNGDVIWEKLIKGGSDSSACLSDGVIYIGGNDSKLYALNAENGDVVWTSKATGPLKSSPCVAYGVVFCGHASGVSVKEGKPVWGQNQKLGAIIQVKDRLNSPAIDADTFAMAAFSGRHVDIRTGMGTGATVWEGQNTYPILDGVIYGINSGMGGGNKHPDLLAHRNAGRKLWSAKFQAEVVVKRQIAISAPAIWTDYVFVASDHGSVVAIDRRNGKRKWQIMIKEGLAIRSSSSVSQDGLLYIGTHDNHLYCIDGVKGEILWKYKTGGHVVSSACIAGQMVYVGSDDGKIYALEGEVKKKVTTDSQRRAIRVLMDPDSPRSAMMKSAGMEMQFVKSIDDILKGDPKTIALVDATPANLKSLSARAQAVEKFTSTGSWLMLWGLSPQGLADFNKLVGMDHLIRPFTHEWVEMPANRDPLMKGMNQIDFWFVDPRIVAGQAAGGYVSSSDAFTYIVDLGDVGPFCKLPEPSYWGKTADEPGSDHWPANLVNGRGIQWQQGFSIALDKDQPTKFTMTLPREETLTALAITPDTNYHKITKVKVTFNDQGPALQFDLKPTQQRQEFTFTARKARSVTIEIAKWDAVGKANVVGIMNVWLQAKRPKDFHAKVKPLLNIGAMVKYPMGKGGIILNQLSAETKDADKYNVIKKHKIIKLLIRNLTTIAEKKHN